MNDKLTELMNERFYRSLIGNDGFKTPILSYDNIVKFWGSRQAPVLILEELKPKIRILYLKEYVNTVSNNKEALERLEGGAPCSLFITKEKYSSDKDSTIELMTQLDAMSKMYWILSGSVGQGEYTRINKLRGKFSHCLCCEIGSADPYDSFLNLVLAGRFTKEKSLDASSNFRNTFKFASKLPFSKFWAEKIVFDKTHLERYFVHGG